VWKYVVDPTYTVIMREETPFEIALLALVVILLLVILRLLRAMKSTTTQTVPADNPAPPPEPPQVHTETVSKPEETVENSPQPVSVLSVPEDPLMNKAWLGLAEECVSLYDEMFCLSSEVSPESKEMLLHLMIRIQQTLERSDVEVTEDVRSFDRLRHKDVGKSMPADGTPVVATLSPGYSVGRKVLRKAIVKTN